MSRKVDYMIEKFRNWKYGLHRLKPHEINSFSFPSGILLKVEPTKCSRDSIYGMQRVLYMLQQYPGRFSFEIWKDAALNFFFYSFKNSVEGMLISQLKSVYPQIKIERAKHALPELGEGDYLASCTLALHGPELSLRCAEDFHHEPFHHIIEAINGAEKAMIQVLFEGLRTIPKDKRILVMHRYGGAEKAPLFRCLIRIVTFSKDGYTAWENCEHIARTFSVFDSGAAHLMLNMNSYYIPFFRDSYRLLKGMVGRCFPRLAKSFMISAPELAAMVHLPVGAEDHGVDYAKPGLAPPPFFGD